MLQCRNPVPKQMVVSFNLVPYLALLAGDLHHPLDDAVAVQRGECTRTLPALIAGSERGRAGQHVPVRGHLNGKRAARIALMRE